MEILRQPLDVMVLPWATQKAASRGWRDGSWLGEVNLRAESRSKGTWRLLCGWCWEWTWGGYCQLTEADGLLGAVVSSVCISAFGASEESLNHCKWMWP